MDVSEVGVVARSWIYAIWAKMWCGGGCVTGSRSPGGRRGPARHHDGEPASARHARPKLRAHHEEIFQFWYAGDYGTVALVNMDASTVVFRFVIFSTLHCVSLIVVFRKRFYNTHTYLSSHAWWESGHEYKWPWTPMDSRSFYTTQII